MPWTTEAILALLRTVLPHAPEHLVLEHDGLRLAIGEGAAGPLAVSASSAAPAATASTPLVTPVAVAAPPTSAVPAQVIPDGGTVVHAPTVGHFYGRPDPGSPPFVTVGSDVEVGATLGLIEVMKMFNAVPAPVAGRINAVLVEDGAFVEHGQPLLIIVPGDTGATSAGS
jgi:acetyl-CoA carboxylase biotin carboxyl carrier protein